MKWQVEEREDFRVIRWAIVDRDGMIERYCDTEREANKWADKLNKRDKA